MKPLMKPKETDMFPQVTLSISEYFLFSVFYVITGVIKLSDNGSNRLPEMGLDYSIL